MLTEGTTKTNVKKQVKESVRPGPPPAPIPKSSGVQPKNTTSVTIIIENILI